MNQDVQRKECVWRGMKHEPKVIREQDARCHFGHSATVHKRWITSEIYKHFKREGHSWCVRLKKKAVQTHNQEMMLGLRLTERHSFRRLCAVSGTLELYQMLVKIVKDKTGKTNKSRNARSQGNCTSARRHAYVTPLLLPKQGPKKEPLDLSFGHFWLFCTIV